MRVIVTGGAGFIGSNLVAGLIERGDEVTVVDNFSTGHREFLDRSLISGRLAVETLDLLGDVHQIADVFEGADAVVHLAANADVRFGLDNPRRDLDQNVVATHNVLEAARTSGVAELVFSSTGSVYGEAEVIPTPEHAPFPRQTSLYGASKAAAEGFIAAYAEGFGLRATVYRFVSILGACYTHGHVIDFVAQLIDHPDHLHILGDGTQRKSYLEVGDCVAAIMGRLGHADEFEVFNLGVDGYCTVNDSVGWICERLGVEPELTYGGGDRGWVGDNPFIFLDTTKIRATGWRPRWSIRDAVEHTVDYLVANPAIVAGLERH
ncbi:MAG: NAD-dependent epimerase/dehydratase family protein [Acidimicrobiia bacterium]